MIEVIRSEFQGPGAIGDFGWMINQPEFSKTLFVFNDNEEEFYAHHSDGSHSCQPGGGNAIIRPFQCRPEPRAAGVPTGSYAQGVHYMGYSSLDHQVREAIEAAMVNIGRVLGSGRFTSLAFSWDPISRLGGRIFSTAQVVRDHIVDELERVASGF